MAMQAARAFSDYNIGLGLGFGGYGMCSLLGGGAIGAQDLVTDNACCGIGVNGMNQFCFDMQQQRNQYFDSAPLFQNMSPHVEKQRQEIDQYIRSQSERLRLVLQEQIHQQLAMLLKKVESKTSALLRQKDEEIAKARNRAMELEFFLKKLEMESQAWQRIAHENEAMVFSLNNSLEQLKEKASACCSVNNGSEDAQSCCGVHEEAEEENRAIGTGIGIGYGEVAAETEQEQRGRKMMMICRGCDSRDSCVLFLPCRHLCSCKACEGFLDSCPVCLTPKKAIIEALIF